MILLNQMSFAYRKQAPLFDQMDWKVQPDQVNFWSIDFKGSYPVFFKEEVPLIALSATIIGGVGCLACWFSCYFRLKEKQV